ncbi:MAG: quinone-dependent dihydroorotate dehydrogenase [Gemmatimonadetes bacterium]|nr:quinone-dependent dihydroorotate dehydrogenase [Gemmatimonadota bacterium]
MLDPYRLIRGSLFRLPPETAHELTATTLRGALATAAARSAVRRATAVDEPALASRVLGIEFPNPVGLAAGFDKAGTLFNALGALGFGFVEIGTVTGEAQPGNPRPRLFRLPADEALVNRMGFNNPGCEAVAATLASGPIEPILGVNIGKSKNAPIEAATADYLRSLDLLQPYAAYLAVNVSSPNTPGLRSLQDAEPLRELVGAVVSRSRHNAGGTGRPLPILVKLAPDLTDPQVEEAVEIALSQGAAGIVATNTTTSRSGLRTPADQVERIGAGGLSGRPLRARALHVVGLIYRLTGGRMPIIGVGGITSPGDAWERIRAGASLVQLYTAFIYGGPAIVHRINAGLARHLREGGFSSLSQAVGSEHH